MSPDLIAALDDYACRHDGEHGLHQTPIADLALMRQTEPVGPVHAVYRPSLCIVAQGAKQLMAGDAVLRYAPGQYLAVTVDLPIIGKVTEASADKPFLALMLDLDLDLLREVADHLPDRPAPRPLSNLGVIVGDLEPPMIDALLRLVRLADRPQAIRALYPAIARELYYWLLASPDGAAILDLALPSHPSRRIAEAIRVIRADFAQPLPIDRLAAVARMSSSSFHHHFKAVTAMTPLQFQKQLRLLEARRLMVSESANAARAAYQVGYESASQFSREYARVFGAPPKRDVADLRLAVV